MKRLAALFTLVLAAFPLFAGGQGEDPDAPFDDHSLVAVHRIHMREVVRIGVSADNAPFSYVDAKEVWQGYDIYFARRIAKEIMGDKPKYLRLVPVTAENWVELLETDQVDIVLPGFGPSPEQSALADFALPYRKAGAVLIAPAVRKGNSELQMWLNDVISRRIEAGFFHKDYEATLRPVYGNTVDPATVVIEGGKIE
ncbi:MAG: transporter substrate-binding domain-containing protein [Spirochaetaceae bacterium]|jgi:polar amino acid transport system substrate-binding protein|nr:transporter substrate-binding domain-containing protein [Spirochaetaceae bacterium]